MIFPHIFFFFFVEIAFVVVVVVSDDVGEQIGVGGEEANFGLFPTEVFFFFSFSFLFLFFIFSFRFPMFFFSSFSFSFFSPFICYLIFSNRFFILLLIQNSTRASSEKKGEQKPDLSKIINPEDLPMKEFVSFFSFSFFLSPHPSQHPLSSPPSPLPSLSSWIFLRE